MATKITLDAQKRELKGKGFINRIRKNGLTPAIVYGLREESLPIAFNTIDFLKLVHGEIHENIIFEINLRDSMNISLPNCIIKEMQVDPVKGSLLHVDFLEIRMDHNIEVHVPIVITGEAIGVKEEGGLLDHSIREILVECLPGNLPEKIEVDVSTLRLGYSLHIKDIPYPEGVKPTENPDKVVVTIIHKLKGRVEEVTEITEEAKEPEVLTQKGAETAKE